jgi:hypothetical protein
MGEPRSRNISVSGVSTAARLMGKPFRIGQKARFSLQYSSPFCHRSEEQTLSVSVT